MEEDSSHRFDAFLIGAAEAIASRFLTPRPPLGPWRDHSIPNEPIGKYLHLVY